MTGGPPADAASGHALVVGSGPDLATLTLRPARFTDRLLSALLGQSLDEQLAAGRPPEETARLAVRAQRIVAIRRRADLARSWERVVTAACRPPLAGPGAVPVCRDRVTAAEPDIRELTARLRAPLPVSARGVAMARLLLTEGGGPLYNPAAPDESLVILLRRATTWLDPAQPLLANARARPASPWGR